MTEKNRGIDHALITRDVRDDNYRTHVNKHVPMLHELVVAAVIVFACLLLHVAGMMVLAEWLFKRREYLETGSKRRFSFCLIVLFSGIMVLHVSETALWAVFFYSRQLFENFETSLYFSLGSYTTIGYGDVVLPTRWRLAGAIEGISGVLLCGISTGFIFAAINRMFQIRFNLRQARVAEEAQN